MTKPTGKGRGAPRGNKRAFKHGRRSQDPHIALAWASMTPEQQEVFAPLMRKYGEEMPGFEEFLAAAEKVTPIASHRRTGRATSSPMSPLYTHTQRQTERTEGALRPGSGGAGAPVNPHLEQAVLEQMLEMSWLSARDFLDRHRPVLRVLARIIGEVTELSETDPAQVHVASKAGLVRSLFHSSPDVSMITGRLMQCPFCAWKQFILAPPQAQVEGL